MSDNGGETIDSGPELWSNRHHPYVAGRLEELLLDFLSDEPDDALWDEFAEITLCELAAGWQERWDRDLGAASHPRPIGPDLELVLLVPTEGERRVFDAPTLVTDAIVFTVRRGDAGLQVAAFGDFVPEPGWPPRLSVEEAESG